MLVITQKHTPKTTSIYLFVPYTTENYTLSELCIRTYRNKLKPSESIPRQELHNQQVNRCRPKGTTPHLANKCFSFETGSSISPQTPNCLCWGLFYRSQTESSYIPLSRLTREPIRDSCLLPYHSITARPGLRLSSYKPLPTARVPL